jgi:hypothetical protein
MKFAEGQASKDGEKITIGLLAMRLTLDQSKKDAPRLWHLLQFDLWALKWKSLLKKKIGEKLASFVKTPTFTMYTYSAYCKWHK